MASPVGMTVSKISLLAIGVNIPNNTTISAAAVNSRAFGPDTRLHAKFTRSFIFRVRSGKAFVKIMAVGLRRSSISCLPNVLMKPS